MGWVGVDFVGLARGTAGDEFADEGGHAGPPVVFLEQGNSSEVPPVGTSKGLMNVFYQGMSGGFRDIEVTLVVEGALVEVPVLWRGTGKGNGGCFHGGKRINDKLVGRGRFGDF